MHLRRLTSLLAIVSLLKVQSLSEALDRSNLLSEILTLSNCNAHNLNWIGDGWCDDTDEYNTPGCNYDMGDCCQSTCDPAIHSNCGVVGYKCKNPFAKENKWPSKGGSKSGGNNSGDGDGGGGSGGDGGGSNGGGGGDGGSGNNGGGGGGSGGSNGGGGGGGGDGGGGGSGSNGGGGGSGSNGGGGGSGSNGGGGGGGSNGGSNGGGSSDPTIAPSKNSRGNPDSTGTQGQLSYTIYNMSVNIMNTTMNCYRSDDANVGSMMQTVKYAVQNYILSRNSTTIKSVSFSPYGQLGPLSSNRTRNLLGLSESTMIKVSIAIQSRSVYAVLDMKIFNASILSGVMERSLRRVAQQSTVDNLKWLRVCRSTVPSVCMREAWISPPRGQRAESYAKLDQCSMTSSEWDKLYERKGKQL